MAYELDQFIADCRTALKNDPGPAGREKVRADLERLLGNKDFVEKYCGDDVERGLQVEPQPRLLGLQALGEGPVGRFGHGENGRRSETRSRLAILRHRSRPAGAFDPGQRAAARGGIRWALRTAAPPRWRSLP